MTRRKEHSPPSLMNGKLSISAVMAEILLQSQSDEIELRSAIPSAWKPSCHFKVSRVRGGFTVDCAWKDRQVSDLIENTCKGNVRINGAVKEILSKVR